jgi:hypothetical protein
MNIKNVYTNNKSTQKLTNNNKTQDSISNENTNNKRS